MKSKLTYAIKIKVEHENSIDKMNSNQESISTEIFVSCTHSKLKLPKFNVAKCNGDPVDWLSFFTQLHTFDAFKKCDLLMPLPYDFRISRVLFAFSALSKFKMFSCEHLLLGFTTKLCFEQVFRVFFAAIQFSLDNKKTLFVLEAVLEMKECISVKHDIKYFKVVRIFNG